MKQEILSVLSWASARAKNSRFIISLRRVSVEDADVVMGYPGLPNELVTMKLGDAYLYETTQEGIIEARVLAIYPSRVEFLLTTVSPSSGFSAGSMEQDISNTSFSESELGRISASLADVKVKVAGIPALTAQQANFLARRLDELDAAARRMGRKDWVNYVAGAVTSICISAAFDPEAARRVLQLLNEAFGWLFDRGILVLGYG